MEVGVSSDQSGGGLLGYLSGLRNNLLQKISPTPKQTESFVIPTGLSSADRSKDEIRRENNQLSTELDNLNREYKKLRQAVEQLSRDYEESKDYDPIRRYDRLKGMIKRTILHFKLNPEEQGCGGTTQVSVGMLQGGREYTQFIENGKRREEKCSRMTKQDLAFENEHLTEQVKEMKRKTSIIWDLINKLEIKYETSKQFVIVQRYRLMKRMVKTVIYDKLI